MRGVHAGSSTTFTLGPSEREHCQTAVPKAMQIRRTAIWWVLNYDSMPGAAGLISPCTKLSGELRKASALSPDHLILQLIWHSAVYFVILHSMGMVSVWLCRCSFT